MSSDSFQLKPTESAVRHAATIHDPAEVAVQLKNLSADLTPEIFRDAIEAGLRARNSTTENSAPTAPGIKQWLDTVEALRTILSSQSPPWIRQDVRNCPQIVSPERHCALVVMTGDALTGTTGSSAPSNKAPKGKTAEAYIQANRQIELLTREARDQGTQVWVLLYHYDPLQQEVRFELSLPVGFEGQAIIEWETRLILGRIDNVPTRLETPDSDDVQTVPDVAFDVTPKTGSL